MDCKAACHMHDWNTSLWVFLSEFSRSSRKESLSFREEKGVAFSPLLQPCCWRGWRRRCPGEDCLHGDLPIPCSIRGRGRLCCGPDSSPWMPRHLHACWATETAVFLFNHRRLKASYILHISNTKDSQRRRAFYNQVVCVVYLRPIGLSHFRGEPWDEK